MIIRIRHYFAKRSNVARPYRFRSSVKFSRDIPDLVNLQNPVVIVK